MPSRGHIRDQGREDQRFNPAIRHQINDISKYEYDQNEQHKAYTSEGNRVKIGQYFWY
jgi:hypothetical protein